MCVLVLRLWFCQVVLTLREFAARGHAALSREAQTKGEAYPGSPGRERGTIPVEPEPEPQGGRQRGSPGGAPPRADSKKSSPRPAAVHDFSVLRMRHVTIHES